jgi:hypothetical protein
MDSPHNGPRAQARLVLYREEVDQLEELARAATLDDWQVGRSGTETIEDAVQWMADTIRKRDDPELWMVFIGDHTVENGTLMPAYTGNGPTSRANAEYLAAAQPRILLKLCAFLRIMLDGQAAIDIPFDSTKLNGGR